jgi:hypothetical protein
MKTIATFSLLGKTSPSVTKLYPTRMSATSEAYKRAKFKKN